MKAIIFDTETTGLVEPEVIEIAWMELTEEWGTGPIFEERFKPTKEIEYGALAAHHILPHELQGCRPSVECKLPTGLEYIIGHNVDFDWEVMGKPPIKRIDTLALARSVYNKVDSHKLGALHYYLEGPTERTRNNLRDAHSAAADIGFCYGLLMAIIPKLGVKSLDQLYKASEEARIPKIMTFGKYRGSPIADVDKGYVQWYQRQPDTDPYLLMAFSRYCK